MRILINYLYAVLVPQASLYEAAIDTRGFANIVSVTVLLVH
jgi:hypothetical protein